MFVSCPLGRCCFALMLHPKPKINSSKSIPILCNAPSCINMDIYIIYIYTDTMSRASRFIMGWVVVRLSWWNAGKHGYRYRGGWYFLGGTIDTRQRNINSWEYSFKPDAIPKSKPSSNPMIYQAYVCLFERRSFMSREPPLQPLALTTKGYKLLYFAGVEFNPFRSFSSFSFPSSLYS